MGDKLKDPLRKGLGPQSKQAISATVRPWRLYKPIAHRWTAARSEGAAIEGSSGVIVLPSPPLPNSSASSRLYLVTLKRKVGCVGGGGRGGITKERHKALPLPLPPAGLSTPAQDQRVSGRV